MSSVFSQAPLRIAFAGLDRTAAYHLERLGLRDDVQVIGAWAPGTVRPPNAGRLHESWTTLLDDANVELVLMSPDVDSRAVRAMQALEAGKHVALGLPLARDRHEADALLGAARRSGRVLAVMLHRRWDDDFRTALAELRSGKLGDLRAAKRLVWEYQVREASVSAADRALERIAPDLLDQMLCLFGSPPDEVSAAITGDGDDGGESGFTLRFGFPEGRSALIDVDTAAIAPLRGGWVLMGSDGAWQNFRRFTRTEENEIYETPIEPLPTLWDEAYTELIRTVRETEPGRIPADTLQARLVVELIAAARESAASGRTVPIVA